MTILTPTFADNTKSKIQEPGNGVSQKPTRGRGRPRIVSDHEPVSGNGGTPWTTAQAAAAPMPMIAAPAIVTPPEQIVNVVPVVAPGPLKVALVGTAPSSRMMAPFNDPTWKIWGCSPGNQNILPRVDAWFEIHGNLLWPENKHYGEPYIEWMKRLMVPLFMQDNSLVPNAISFPKQEMVDEFGPYFFTSSFSWMMALAIKQGAKEIALYGIDMASREEYIIQRPGAYYFFCEAARRGCKIWAPYESDIMQPPGLYGYSDVSQLGRKLLTRKAELMGRSNEMGQQLQSVTHNKTYLDGALEDLDYMISIHMGAQDNSSTGYLSKLLASNSGNLSQSQPNPTTIVSQG